VDLVAGEAAHPAALGIEDLEDDRTGGPGSFSLRMALCEEAVAMRNSLL
jgi:hypothetical protein